MNIDTPLRMNYFNPSTDYFQKSTDDERIAFEGKATTPTPVTPISMTRTMASANIAMALDIMKDDYTNVDHDDDCTKLDCNEISMHPLALFEQQRSTSPRSVLCTLSSTFPGKDCHVVADYDDDIDDADSFAIDPLPLTTSASTDLKYLMQDYFGSHNEVVIKETLPKTKLTFYEDRKHKIDDIGIEEVEDELKGAEEKINLFLGRSMLLPEFEVTKDSINWDPFRYFVSGDAPTMTELPKQSLVVEDKNRNVDVDRTVKKNNKNVQANVAIKKNFTKKKPASKTKNPTKNKMIIVTNNSNNKKKHNSTIQGKKTEGTNARMVSQTWDLNFEKLVAFYAKNNHSSVLRSNPDAKLSGWVKRQRNNLKEGKLSTSQIQRLDCVDFTWNRLEQAWQNKYTLLKNFAKESGKSEVPTKYNRSLAEWTQRQRREYRTMKTTMTLTRIQKLEAIQHWRWDTKKAEI